jgi:hypothetical protein
VLGHRVVGGRVPVLLLEGVALLHGNYRRSVVMRESPNPLRAVGCSRRPAWQSWRENVRA